MSSDTGPRGSIENTLATFAWAFDMNELELLDNCFAQDAEVDFGSGAPARGRAEVIANLRRLRAGFTSQELAPWHVLSNLMIRTQADARVEATSFYTILTKGREGPPNLRGIGYYEDSFVYEGGRWVVQNRRVRPGGVF